MNILKILGTIAIILFFLNGGGCGVGAGGTYIILPDAINLPGGVYGNIEKLTLTKNPSDADVN
jgi:hypothetical protein